MTAMRRLLAFILGTALLVAVAVWLTDRPGAVTVHWHGWRIDTTVTMLVLTIVVVVALVEVLLRLGLGLIRAPRRWLAERRARRLAEGYRALSDGLAAVSAGDKRASHTLARRAEKLLADPSLTGLLSARAAEMAGDAKAAEQRLEAMVARPETAFVGLEGLMRLALTKGDNARALDYARRAWALGTRAEGLAPILFDLQARAGQWAEAELTLTEARKRGVVAEEGVGRRLALVLTQRALTVENTGDKDAAAILALKAHQTDPAFVPAATLAARLLLACGKPRKAAAVIEKTWGLASHPDLARVWRDLAPTETPLARVKRLERLIHANREAADSHIALAEAALDAGLWGQARSHLMKAEGRRPAAAYGLLARLEESEHKDEAAARAWRTKAETAPPGPAWTCSACGTRSESWSAACPSCGAIDGLAWRSQSGKGQES